LTKLQNPVAEKLYGLDHLRTLAIALVFFFHYPAIELADWLADFKDFSWVGVELFLY